MKPVRVFLYGFGALVFLLIVALVVAFNSSFQTWAARRALAGQPDLKATLGRVSAGLDTVELRDVRAEVDGAVVVLPALDLEVPLWAAGVNNDVSVRRLVAKGWTLDLTRASSSASSEKKSSPFEGVFSQLKLPVDLAVDGVDLEGEVILPGPNSETPARAKVSIRGGGLLSGGEGKFEIRVNGEDGDGQTLQGEGSLAAAMDTPRTFRRLVFASQSSVTGDKFPQGVRLGLNVNAVRTDTGEDYQLSASSDGRQLAALNATYATEGRRINGTWKVDGSRGDVAPFLLGQPLPEFVAKGEGSFQTDGAFSEVHATGRLDATAERLELLSPEFAPLGRVNVVADFDVLQHGLAVRVERFTGEFRGKAQVASVRALQPFELVTNTGELRVADPSKDLIAISLHGLPVSWAAAFLGDLSAEGADVRGEFVASARDGGLAFKTVSPLALAGLSLSQKDARLLSNVDIALSVSADYTPAGWQAELSDLSVSSGGKLILSLHAKAGQLAGAHEALKATGDWRADLPELFRQPVGAVSGASLAGGIASGEFSASLDGIKALQARIGLRDLVAPGGEALPTVALDLRADIAEDGKVTLHAPVIVEREGKKSDLTIAGTVRPSGNKLAVDARLTSEQILVEDLRLFALPLVAEEKETTRKPAGKPDARDIKPFWEGLEGEVALAIKKVIYGGAFEVTAIEGTLRLDDSSMNFEGVRAVFGKDSDLRLGGGMKFTPKNRRPYSFATGFQIQNFDTGPLFRAIDPAKLPTVDSRVTIITKVASEGLNLSDVAQRVRGDVLVTSRGGVFRALGLPGSYLDRAESAVTMLGGLVNSSSITRVQSFLNLSRALADIKFDQLNVSATRDKKQNLQLNEFTLISPELRLTGSGSIQHVAGKSFMEQPLDMTLNLGTRGQIGDWLKQLNVLDQKQQDSLGYTSIKTPVRLAGTLQRPDVSEFAKTLAEAAVEKSGIFNGLLGK